MLVESGVNFVFFFGGKGLGLMNWSLVLGLSLMYINVSNTDVFVSP
jgi:hypothetical protein